MYSMAARRQLVMILDMCPCGFNLVIDVIRNILSFGRRLLLAVLWKLTRFSETFFSS